MPPRKADFPVECNARWPKFDRKILPQITPMGADKKNNQTDRIVVFICVHPRYLRFIFSDQRSGLKVGR